MKVITATQTKAKGHVMVQKLDDSRKRIPPKTHAAHSTLFLNFRLCKGQRSEGGVSVFQIIKLSLSSYRTLINYLILT